ncbi:MAG: transposase family protein [Methylococcaceae bacterium]|nr:transposase family protein [Methylococcaceae bacterium]
MEKSKKTLLRNKIQHIVFIAYLLIRRTLHVGWSKNDNKTQQLRSLPNFFKEIDGPRQSRGRRHRLSTALGIAAGAVLCDMRSYEAIFDWAASLSQISKEHFHFRCRYDKGQYTVPRLSIIRDILTPAGLYRLE